MRKMPRKLFLQLTASRWRKTKWFVMRCIVYDTAGRSGDFWEARRGILDNYCYSFVIMALTHVLYSFSLNQIIPKAKFDMRRSLVVADLLNGCG